VTGGALLQRRRGALEERGEYRRDRVLGLTGQMHGAGLLDERDEPLRSSEKGLIQSRK
jgi:sugar (pentulose or hexulose) kinase